MPNSYTFGGIQLDVDPSDSTHGSTQAEAAVIDTDPDEPFRILILGNFSGRNDDAPAGPVRVDRDNFEDVLRAFKVHVDLALGNGQLGDASLSFASLEDFDPDYIYRRSDLFRHFTRPVEYEITKAATAQVSSRTLEEHAKKITSGSLLDAVVEHTSASNRASLSVSEPVLSGDQDDFQSAISRIVQPHVLKRPGTDSLQQEAERRQSSGMLMRSILHDNTFQQLEAAWRALDLLVRGLDTDEAIQLYIYDLPKERLSASLLRASDPRHSDIYRVVMQESTEGEELQPWAVLAGNYSFDRNSNDDVLLLERLAQLGQAAGAPFLAECVPSRDENKKAFAAWTLLRTAPHAKWLGLAIPRFLLRLPYGAQTHPIDSFDFEEMPNEPRHSEYLWANPAFACVYLLARLFEEDRWNLQAVPNERMDGLPVHDFKVNGIAKSQPCTEVLLTDRDCDDLMHEGLMALSAFKGQDSLRLVRFQSVAEPATSLVGRWITTPRR